VLFFPRMFIIADNICVESKVALSPEN